MKRILAMMVILACLMAGFLIWISNGEAYPGGPRATGGSWPSGPNTPATNADNAPLLKDMFTGDVNPDQLALFSDADTATGMTIAEQAGGYAPLFGITFGSLVSGIDIGLKLPAFNIGGVISYKEWKNENYVGYSHWLPAWTFTSTQINSASPGCTCFIPANHYYNKLGGGVATACNNSLYTGCDPVLWADFLNWETQDAGKFSLITNTTTTATCEGVTVTPSIPPGGCYMAIATTAQMLAHGVINRRDPNWYYNTCPASACTQVDQSAATLPSVQALNKALDAIGAFDNSSHGNPDDHTMTAILNYLEAHGSSTTAPVNPPGVSPGSPAYVFEPFVLPKPTPTQTYQDYLDELRNHGWLGDATVSDNLAAPGWSTSTFARQNLIDGAPTSVGVGTTTALIVDSAGASLPWPTAAISLPTITTATQGITVVKMPTGLGASVLPSASCSSCTIDWTPIEAISFGSKFPFGIPGWINSFFSAVPTSGSCPNLNIGKPAAIGGGTLAISFCNTAWETTYRPTVFLVLEALMTFAGVAFLAQKLIGNGGGEEV